MFASKNQLSRLVSHERPNMLSIPEEYTDKRPQPDRKKHALPEPSKFFQRKDDFLTRFLGYAYSLG